MLGSVSSRVRAALKVVDLWSHGGMSSQVCRETRRTGKTATAARFAGARGAGAALKATFPRTCATRRMVPDGEPVSWRLLV